MTRIGRWALATLVASTSASLASACEQGWPLWQAYRDRFISADGRVIDPDAGARTTSEGQAYALFFALVARDESTFDRLLGWTARNLAGGDLSQRLPAWLWGERDGRWGVLDDNPASDADLWLAYTLLEHGRLFRDRQNQALAAAIASRIISDETVVVPRLGRVLLPGARGFVGDDGSHRVNPSYAPPQVLARLAQAFPKEPWREIAASSGRVWRESSPRGLVPDWVSISGDGTVGTDPRTGPVGSYDAIRAYLWQGMMPSSPQSRSLEAAVTGLDLGPIPEFVHPIDGSSTGEGPVGFSAALLPRRLRRGGLRAIRPLVARLESARTDRLFGTPPRYYDQNLALFALGYIEQRYRFEREGRLVVRGEAPCPSH